MRNPGETLPKHPAEPVDTKIREREFVRAVPQLRRFANRLLPDMLEVETVISEVREAWNCTEGCHDAPIRHLLRLVAQGCIERQRAKTRSMPEPTDEERVVLAIFDVAEISLLIAVNRLPRRAREAYVASVLGRAIEAEPETATLLECAEYEVRADHPCLSSLTVPSHNPPVHGLERVPLSGNVRAE